ncbi:response regulator [Halobacteriovorax sp.]|uniref:response regulator n=1 Tax=Halobacteriovorax sp. TaxID=2020862 RepID=UPI0035636604
MAEKILVADDSLTIQKVISITLSNTDYELVECLNENDLLQKLEVDSFDLVLLDFNLSEKLSGYDLAKKIKDLSPDTQVLAMLGTFDTIDDYQLSDCGIGDKVVKPFESEKFIQKCRILLDSKSEATDINLEETESYSTESEEEIDEPEDIIGDDWVVDSPRPSDDSSATLSKSDQEPEELVFDEATAEDALSEEMKGWGIEVPSVIGTENKFGVFPPKIEAQSVETEEEVEELDNVLTLNDNAQESQDSDLISLDEISDNGNEEEEDLDETDPSFQMPQEFLNEKETYHSIEEEIDKDDFWAVDGESEEDSFDENQNSFETKPSSSVEDLDDIAEDEVDQIFADLESEIDSEKESYTIENLDNTNTRSPAIEVDIDTAEIVAQVKEAITPALEELVQKFCREKIEQVAWEVIPDLAENLIKKEIKDITSTLEH